MCPNQKMLETCSSANIFFLFPAPGIILSFSHFPATYLQVCGQIGPIGLTHPVPQPVVVATTPGPANVRMQMILQQTCPQDVREIQLRCRIAFMPQYLIAQVRRKSINRETTVL